MPRLGTSVRLGNASATSLIRSANSLQSEINSYQDSLAAYQYELSPKTQADLDTYQKYLSGRITNLQSTGSISDAQKALTLTKTLTSAVRSNVSADIQRENIQIMAGNASLPDKYNTIVNQYTRAVSNGDYSLAQSLESQAYSVSQQIQYQQYQAEQAANALSGYGYYRRGGGSSSASGAGDQTEIISALDDSLKQLNNDVRVLGVKSMNKITQEWVGQNKDALQQLGVIIPDGAQPNYWDLVKGVQGAKYNAMVLKAQAQSLYNPAAAQNTLRDALLFSQGGQKIQTLGGSLTIQEVMQAAQDPAMFAYDNATGQYKRTAAVGYQFVDGHVAPQYSGIIGDDKRNQSSGALNGNNVQTVFFLNPTQTASLTNLGLNFSQNINGKSVQNTATPGQYGTTGDGVMAQLSMNSPKWLRDLLGENGATRVYTDQAGNLQFEGPASNGQGMTYYTLMSIGGLHGIYEHFADGTTKIAGGDYGFDQGAAQLLINMGQQKQYQIQLQAEAERKAEAARLAALQVAKPPAPLPHPLPVVRRPAPPPVYTSATNYLQPTIHTTSIQPTYNPQPATYNPQPATQYTSNVTGVPLYQPKLTTIKL